MKIVKTEKTRLTEKELHSYKSLLTACPHRDGASAAVARVCGAGWPSARVLWLPIPLARLELVLGLLRRWRAAPTRANAEDAAAWRQTLPTAAAAAVRRAGVPPTDTGANTGAHASAHTADSLANAPQVPRRQGGQVGRALQGLPAWAVRAAWVGSVLSLRRRAVWGRAGHLVAVRWQVHRGALQCSSGEHAVLAV